MASRLGGGVGDLVVSRAEGRGGGDDLVAAGSSGGSGKLSTSVGIFNY